MKADHYSQAKRETVAAQVISILGITTPSTWLSTTTLHPYNPCTNGGI